MFELLGGGIVGSLLGGVFRLVPEFLKAFDKKSERSHELSMFDKQCDVEKTRGAQKLSEIGAERDSVLDTGAMAAFQSAIQQQTDMVKAAGGWAASLSASVRPVMTYYLLAVYGVVKTCLVVTQMQSGVSFVDVMPRLWSADDMALLSGVVNYWILDRTLAKRGI
jgi:hypothetical protein